MQYNKLVRDRIIEIWNPKYGKDPKYHIADEIEFQFKLKQKLKEEVNEFLKTKGTDELIDVLEVVYALARTKGVSLEELEKMRLEKIVTNGSFDKRIILERVE